MTDRPNIEYRTDQNGDSGVLFLRGDLDIQQNKRIISTLVDVMNRSTSLQLNISELLSIDLILIQTLFAAHHYALKNEIEFEIEGECPQCFLGAVQAAGLKHQQWLCFG